MVYPQSFCSSCKRSLQKAMDAAAKGVPYKCCVTTFQWQTHSCETCMVRCLHPNMMACVLISLNPHNCHFISTQQVGRPPKVIHPAKESCAIKLLKYIDTISPLPLNALGYPNNCFVADDNLLVLQDLKCSLCLEVLNQPLELPCKALVCAKCIKQWIVVSADIQCPCCYDTEPLHLNPAPTLVLNILGDVLIHCAACSRDIKARSFDDHQCTPSPTEEEMITAADVLRRMSSTSPENPVLQCPTRGRVCTHTYTHIHTHTHTHTHTRTHTHTDTHTDTYSKCNN